jgi:hypothetical protein
MKAEEPMTDETPRTVHDSHVRTMHTGDAARSTEPAPAPGAGRAGRRQTVVAGRIAVAGIGIAAMVGLVANMEIADGRAHAADPAPAAAPVAQITKEDMHQWVADAVGRAADAKANRPIVLTPHAVVHTVGVPASGGGYSGGGSGYAAAPAAAPVASSGGSRP